MKKAKSIYVFILCLIILVVGVDLLAPIPHFAHMVFDAMIVGLLAFIAALQIYLLFFWKPKIIEDNGIVEDLEVFSFFIEKSLRRLYRVGTASAGRSAVVYVNVECKNAFDIFTRICKKQMKNDVNTIANIMKKALRRSDLIAVNHKNNSIFCYLDDILNDRCVIETTERMVALIDKEQNPNLYIGVVVSKFDHLQTAEELFDKAITAAKLAKESGQQIYFSVL
jgi:hypothetical protein